MPPSLTASAILLTGIAVAELGAWWWTRPAPVAPGTPVLVWRPRLAAGGAGEGDGSFTFIPRPEIYDDSVAMLRCSNGRVVQAGRPGGLSLFLAFFEWDYADTGSTLEAFRHLPEACMGSIGLKLVTHQPPRTWTLDGTTLTFDHAIFRESLARGPAATRTAPSIHAFRAVWVAGLGSATPRDTILGRPQEQLRTIRIRSALERFRPPFARVIQGTVRGTTNPDLAWQAFRDAMLVDLRFAPH